jgi:hypothetical protein
MLGGLPMPGHGVFAKGAPGSGISAAVLKLIEVIEEENALLGEHKIVFHGGYTDRKNQALRELMAAQRSEGVREAALACGDLLRRLSSALRVNAGLLKLHIGAVGEISDIIIGGLREAESDGTYSRNRHLRR